MALFQGGEDDEPIAPQDVHGDMSSDNSNIAASNSLISSGLQFGAIYFDEKYGKNMVKFTSAGLSSNIFFRGALLLGKEKSLISFWPELLYIVASGLSTGVHFDILLLS